MTNKDKASAKERKRKVTKAQTYSGRRRADRRKRERQRPRQKRRREAQRIYKFRVKVVRSYWKWCQQMTEKRAIERVQAHYNPTGQLALSASTIRRWSRVARASGFGALRPQSTRPQSIHYQVPEVVVGIIYTLRTVLGWGGNRIAAELRARQIETVCGDTVYRIFERLGLSVRTYALQSRSDGIAYRRYEKKRANAQWHIDLKHLKLADGTPVYICIIIDDYSRYALAAVAGTQARSEWVAQVTRQALRLAGCPEEMVSDNGSEFVTRYENSLTQFGQLLFDEDITHRTIAPHYPQGNGKAEAFIKTLNREVLQEQTFDTLHELQAALDRYLTYYNNYRAHSALGWRPPVTRFAGVAITIQGLAGIPGIEPMADRPEYQPSFCDPPLAITPTTAARSRALVLVQG
jgi:transposase InsO family protein